MNKRDSFFGQTRVDQAETGNALNDHFHYSGNTLHICQSYSKKNPPAFCKNQSHFLLQVIVSIRCNKAYYMIRCKVLFNTKCLQTNNKIMFIEKRYVCVSVQCTSIVIEIKYGETSQGTGTSYCGTIEQGIEYEKNESF